VENETAKGLKGADQAVANLHLTQNGRDCPFSRQREEKAEEDRGYSVFKDKLEKYESQGEGGSCKPRSPPPAIRGPGR